MQGFTRQLHWDKCDRVWGSHSPSGGIFLGIVETEEGMDMAVTLNPAGRVSMEPGIMLRP